MTRLISAIRLDCRFQWRYGFYYAAGLMTLVWIAVMRALRPDILPVAVPFIVFVDLGVVGFYFMAGTLLLEKGEGTLSALLVSPLRFWEYLASRLFSLTLLAVLVSLAAALAGYGPCFNIPLFTAGVILTSLLCLLVGVIAAAPYDSISRFIIPAQLYVATLDLPLMYFFGIWRHPWFYLLPTQGSLLLLRGAFGPVQSWQMFYAVGYQLLWLAALVFMAQRRFDRYLAARWGER